MGVRIPMISRANQRISAFCTLLAKSCRTKQIETTPLSNIRHVLIAEVGERCHRKEQRRRLGNRLRCSRFKKGSPRLSKPA